MGSKNSKNTKNNSKPLGSPNPAPIQIQTLSPPVAVLPDKKAKTINVYLRDYKSPSKG